MGIAPVLSDNSSKVPLAGTLDFTAELRAAVLSGDEERTGSLLTRLLRIKQPTNGQRFTLQLQALQGLVKALRSLSICDETTGLHNRRGFMQGATRLLDVAVRERQAAELIYFQVAQPQLAADSGAPLRSEIRLRHMGNLMRDLFPDYGVYEVLGRLGRSEFAALTLDMKRASRQAVVRRTAASQRSGALPGLQLSAGVARFDPQRPVPVDELLQRAQRAVGLVPRIPRMASSGHQPPGRSDALATVSGWRSNGVAQD